MTEDDVFLTLAGQGDKTNAAYHTARGPEDWNFSRIYTLLAWDRSFGFVRTENTVNKTIKSRQFYPCGGYFHHLS